VHVNALRAKTAAKKALSALKKGNGISDALIKYVETERRVDDWARKNIEAITNSKKLSSKEA
jgi:hypothetical protein